MKEYTIALTDELAVIYEDIAKMNQKDVEDCLVIILERVIRTMLNHSDEKDVYKRQALYPARHIRRIRAFPRPRL